MSADLQLQLCPYSGRFETMSLAPMPFKNLRPTPCPTLFILCLPLSHASTHPGSPWAVTELHFFLRKNRKEPTHSLLERNFPWVNPGYPADLVQTWALADQEVPG